jgi:formamidopyrimidine-DNA glycosylase
MLFFQDMRKFGYVKLYSNSALEQYFIAKKLAKEPTADDFSFDYFNQQLQRHRRAQIKAVLLNQSAIAGIGNIYADDICWQAHLKPPRRVYTLTQAERRTLHSACKKIITQAIQLGGTSFSHYYKIDGQLGSYWNKRKVYDRVGQPCRRCGSAIKKTRCAGRGTHYCSACQR